MKLRVEFALWTSLFAFIAVPLTLLILSIFYVENFSDVNVLKQLPEMFIFPLTWKWAPIAFAFSFLIAPIAVKTEKIWVIFLTGLLHPIFIAFFTIFIFSIYALNDIRLQTVLNSLELSIEFSVLIFYTLIPCLLGLISLIVFRLIYYISAA